MHARSCLPNVQKNRSKKVRRNGSAPTTSLLSSRHWFRSSGVDHNRTVCSMSPSWKIAALGGVIGAIAAVVVVFGAATLGHFPSPSDEQFNAYLMSHPSIVVAM